jgi:thioredoxin-related protein
MKTAFLTLFLSLSFILNAQESQIKFREFNSFNEIIAAAQKENKDIMLYFHYKGCGWCWKMEKTTFKDSAVGQYYNNNFINVSLDYLKDSIGMRLKKKLKVHGAPYYMFMSPKGNVNHFEWGYKPATSFIRIGKIALDKTKNFSFYAQKLLEKDHSIETISSYIEIKGYNEESDSLIKLMIDYNQNNPSELFGEKSFRIIYPRGDIQRRPYYNYVKENYDNFLQYAGRDLVEYSFRSNWSFNINNVVYFFFHGNRRRERAKEHFAKLKIPNYERICSYSDFEYALDQFQSKSKSRKRFERFIESADNYFEKYNDDWRALSIASMGILQSRFKDKDKEYMVKAKNWAELSLRIKECPKSLYSYSILLCEMEDNEKAIETLKKLIKITKQKISNENSYYRELAEKELEKINI